MPQKDTRKIGLARALSKLGFCSRSQAVELILAGRVQLNGSVRRDPETPVHLGRDRIAVDDHPVGARQKIYLMMNKPRGLVTTAADEKGRTTVYDILGKSGQSLPWLAPVGRLDKASEGLLLFTNDSEWGARIAAPETHLEKTYHAQVNSTDGNRLARLLMKGMKSGGESLRANRASLLRAGEKNCWLEITLEEGKNRQIRRMLSTLNIEVLRLVRTKIGPLELGKLAKGTFRPLTPEEKLALDHAMAKAFAGLDLTPPPSLG